MCSLLSRENVFVESKWWLVVTFSNKAEEDASKKTRARADFYSSWVSSDLVEKIHGVL